MEGLNQDGGAVGETKTGREEEPQAPVAFDKRSLLARVTALELDATDDTLYIGRGSELEIVDLNSHETLARERVLPTSTIHGIRIIAGMVYVFGHKQVKVHSWNQYDSELLLEYTLELPNLVKDCLWIPPSANSSGVLLVGLAHNALLHYQGNDLCVVPSLTKTVQCQHVSLLYSMAIAQGTHETCLVASGTAMWKIVLWDAFGSGVPLCVVRGHQGSIMELRWHDSGKYLASVSDDRSLKLWAVDNVEGENKGSASVHVAEKWGAFGHSARVWGVDFIKSPEASDASPFAGVVTSSEDGTVGVWNHEGQLCTQFTGHNGLNVWRVRATDTVVVSGGDDGSTKIWPIGYHVTLAEARRAVEKQPSRVWNRQEVSGFQGYTTEIPEADEGEGNGKRRRFQVVYMIARAGGREVVIVTSTGSVLVHNVSNREWVLLGNVFDHMGSIEGARIITCGALHEESQLFVGLLSGDLCLVQAPLLDRARPSLSLRCAWKGYSGRVLGCWWCMASSSIQDEHAWDDLSFFTAGERGEITWWGVSIPSQDAQSEQQARVARLATYSTPNFSPPSALAFSETLNVLAVGNVIGAIFLFDTSEGQTLYRMWRRGESFWEFPSSAGMHLVEEPNHTVLPSCWIRSIHGRNRVSGLAFHGDKLWVGGPTGTLTVLFVESKFPFATREEGDRFMIEDPSSWTLLWIQPKESGSDMGPTLCKRQYMEVDLCFDGGHKWPHARGFVCVPPPPRNVTADSSKSIQRKPKWVVWKGDYTAAKDWGLSPYLLKRVCRIEAKRVGVVRVSPVQTVLGWRFLNSEGAGSPLYDGKSVVFGFEDNMSISQDTHPAPSLQHPLLVVGVRENNLLLWSVGNSHPPSPVRRNMKGRSLLLEANIGGWRKRPYTVHCRDNGVEEDLLVAWQPARGRGPPTLCILHKPRSEAGVELSSIPRHITIPGDFHGKIARGIVLLPYRDVASSFAVTVSEDNSLRLLRLAADSRTDSRTEGEFKESGPEEMSPSKRVRVARGCRSGHIQALQASEAHVAGIRCVAVTARMASYNGLFPSMPPDDLARISCPTIVVSGGSRDQLLVWEASTASDGDGNPHPSPWMSWICSCVYTQSHAEQRIHSVAILPLPFLEDVGAADKAPPVLSKFLVLSGNSEGVLALYLVDTKERECMEVLRCCGTKRPVLSLEFVVFPASNQLVSPELEGQGTIFNGSDAVHILLAQGCSDGSISLWDFSPVVRGVCSLLAARSWAALLNAACSHAVDVDASQGDSIPSTAAGAKGEYTPWRDGSREKKAAPSGGVDQGLPNSKRKVPRIIANPTPSLSAAAKALSPPLEEVPNPVLITRWSPHVAGVNACDGVVEWDLEDDVGTVSIVSGGDDQAFVVSRVSLRSGRGNGGADAVSPLLTATQVRCAVIREAMSSAFTGLKLQPCEGGWVAATCGVDQRLQLWKVDRVGIQEPVGAVTDGFSVRMDESPLSRCADVELVEAVGVRFLRETLVEIPDVGDLDARWVASNVLEVVVVGHGIQHLFCSLQLDA